MQYSLLHRFQGTLVGSLIRQAPSLTIFSQLSRDIGDRLLASDNLKAADWLELYKQYHQRLSFPLSSSHLILATLPLQLRYYDHRCQLQAQLDILEKIWQQPPQTLKDVLVWSYSLTLALQEKLDPKILVSQLLDAYPTLNTPLLQSLRQLPQLLNHSLPLGHILSHFPNHPNPSILAAFSCFIPTPEDAKLCLLRASQSQQLPELTLALSGVLCGAYNSIIGLPLSWRLGSPTQELITNTTQQAQLLFARWSGVYQVSSYPAISHHALGATGIIQHRKGLKIISQK